MLAAEIDNGALITVGLATVGFVVSWASWMVVQMLRVTRTIDAIQASQAALEKDHDDRLKRLESFQDSWWERRTTGGAG